MYGVAVKVTQQHAPQRCSAPGGSRTAHGGCPHAAYEALMAGSIGLSCFERRKDRHNQDIES